MVASTLPLGEFFLDLSFHLHSTFKHHLQIVYLT